MSLELGPEVAINHEFNSEDGGFVFSLVRCDQGGCCYLVRDFVSVEEEGCS